MMIEEEYTYPKSKYWYDKGVEGLYHEGEEEIAKDEYWSYRYVCNNLKGRFRACERQADRKTLYWLLYVRFLKDRGIEI